MTNKKYPKMTKDIIEKVALKIIEVLCEKELAGDMRIYYNNRCIQITHKLDKNWNSIWLREDIENIDPHNYFEYAAYDHIISISTEGGLYDRLNYGSGDFPAELEKLFDKYGIYHELGNAWNLSFFPVDDDKERIEYTKYTKPKKPIYIWCTMPESDCPEELMKIMNIWYDLSRATGDRGGCVIGAKMKFNYKGETYHMASASPWQGEGSWTPHVDYIKNKLSELGATEISWDYGMLD